MRSMCTFLHESIRLAPTSFVYLKEAVFPLKLLERKSARFSLCAIDIEPSANRKMVILFIATLIDGVAMEKGNFHSREEIINIITRCKNSNRLIIHHFLDGLKPPLILGQQNRAVWLDKPCNIVSSTLDFVLKRAKYRIGIGYRNEK